MALITSGTAFIASPLQIHSGVYVATLPFACSRASIALMSRWLFKAVCLQRSMTCLDRSALSFLPLRPSMVLNAGLSTMRTTTETMEFEPGNGSD
jgi:hypothetical protein